MGTYLSTPVLKKDESSGCDDLSMLLNKDESNVTKEKSIPVAWGCVDMQGWRKSMEDAHVARLDVMSPLNDAQQSKVSNFSKVFAVFDGHGGPEVARFCGVYLVDVLVSQKQWNSSGMDVGGALISCFHELDCMIDDPERRDEISNFRTIDHATMASTKICNKNKFNYKIEAKSSAAVAESVIPPSPTVTPSPQPPPNSDTSPRMEIALSRSESTKLGALGGEDEKCGDNKGVTETSATSIDTDITSNEITEGIQVDTEEKQQEIKNSTGNNDGSQISNSEPAVVNVDNSTFFDDDNSKEGSESSSSLGSEADSTAVAVDEDDSMDDIDDFDNIVEPVVSSSLTNLGNDEGSAPNSPEENESVSLDANKAVIPVTSRTFQNGRKVCTLPDHPIHAGCTAVVAVLVNDVLTVANAGDSRAVLCRKNGVTEALSYDHKPLQEREMDRITRAGGFVNQFGRVNGNLNLSRSIGDLKYKQTKSLPPSAQIITAEPDILQVKLNPGDEFFILGCDGIWDCLSNEQAVFFVRDRINIKTPTEIVTEMLDEIVSDDPRATQGIGGDNMTCMIIDLLPHTRPYRKI